MDLPAAQVLLDYAHGGCPVNTGAPWSKEIMDAAIEKGPHVLALDEAAMEQLQQEVKAKAECGQCRIVDWDTIKDSPPEQLKISPIAMIPHKSRLLVTEWGTSPICQRIIGQDCTEGSH